MKLKRSLKKFWTSFSLKFSLFRIWFMKNILVFLQIILLVSLISVLTGLVKADTPILGILVYPIFAPLVDEIRDIIDKKEINDVMSFLSVSISLLVSLSVFTIKVKSIALSDIKSKKIKLAMYKANLYFNENGRLVKKVEKATGKDLDGDGVIDQGGEPIQNESIFSGIKRSFNEFLTILSVRVNSDDDKENEKEYNKAISDANLEQSAEAVKEMDEIILNGRNNFLKDKVEEKIYESKLEEISNEEDEEQDTVIKKSIFRRVVELFRRKKVDTDEIEDIQEDKNSLDVITTNNEEEPVIKKEIKNTTKNVVTNNSVIKKNEKTLNENKNDPASAFLNNLRNSIRK